MSKRRAPKGPIATATSTTKVSSQDTSIATEAAAYLEADRAVRVAVRAALAWGEGAITRGQLLAALAASGAGAERVLARGWSFLEDRVA